LHLQGIGGLDEEGGGQPEVHLSGVHHLGHAGHPLREEGGVFKVTCQFFSSDIAVHPSLLTTADDGGLLLLLHLRGLGALPFTSRTLNSFFQF